MDSIIESPLGKIWLCSNSKGLSYCGFDDPGLWTPTERDLAIVSAAQVALKRYFAGDTFALRSIPLAPEGSKFQTRVWKALLQIPAGSIISYKDLAHKVGMPTAFRAIGGACSKNPVCLFIPCHRVIGANLQLGGYSAGIKRKIWLLQHEGLQTQDDHILQASE